MGVVRGAWRLFLTGWVFAIGTPTVIVLSWLPLTRRGARLAAWAAAAMCRSVLAIFNVQLECRERARFIGHQGFIFPNHSSYLDILLLMSVVPMRFLAKSDIRQWPLVGRIAQANETVFVNREDKTSRAEAKAALTALKLYPPIAIFPEGKIVGDKQLHPFRFGAFELAIAHRAPILPAVFLYEDYKTAAWGDETLRRAIWRVAKSAETRVRLVALRTISTQPDDDAAALALETHGAMQAALVAYGGYAERFITPGL